MAPIPIGRLLVAVQFRILTIVFVLFAKVLAIGAVFVVVPIVVILVGTIVDAGLFFSSRWSSCAAALVLIATGATSAAPSKTKLQYLNAFFILFTPQRENLNQFPSREEVCAPLLMNTVQYRT